MAKSIDPFGKKPEPKKLEEPPRPAVMPAGVKGTPPLPAGRPVRVSGSPVLTPNAQATLEAVGWEEGMPIPQNMADILHQVTQQHLQETVPLPIDPTKPIPKVKTVDINDLPPEKKKEILKLMAEAAASEKEAQAAAAEEAKRAAENMAVPGIAQARMHADQAVAEFETKAAPKAVPPGEPTKPNAPYRAEAPPASPPVTPTPAPTETGAEAVNLECPHCGWDQRHQDIPDPPYEEKMKFLHAFLGGVPYTKEYSLLGGALRATFRTLSMREVDLVYLQAHNDRIDGKIQSELDYMEYANRYRLYLQIVGMKARGDMPMTYEDLPDAYSKSANPNGTGFWVTEEREAELGPGKTGLPVIESYLMNKVLKQEAIFRAIHMQCRDFNRLVAKLEVNVPNENFWQPTEGPP